MWRLRFLVAFAGAIITGAVADDITDASLVSIDYRELESYFEEASCVKTDNVQSCKAAWPSDLVKSIGMAFGPEGMGIIQVSDIPRDMMQLRSKLLPMARSLSRLSSEELHAVTLPETFYSIGWSHGREQLESGKYDFAKGSFYVNPFDGDQPTKSSNETINVFPPSLQPDFEERLEEINRFMAKVGLWIARLCDEYMLKFDDRNGESSKSVGVRSIHDSLKTCYNCKARLLHYFPTSDSPKNQDNGDEWCGWHTDHGSLTALLPGMYLDENGDEVDCSSDRGDEQSKLCREKERSGLYIRDPRGDVVRVALAKSSIGFQIGETITIMTGGRLRATPHAVKSFISHSSVSRESLALFLQPEPDEILPMISETLKNTIGLEDPKALESRWKPTFGEFQQATLAAYS